MFRDLLYQILQFGDPPGPFLCVYFLLYVSQFRLVGFRRWLDRVLFFELNGQLSKCGVH